MKWLWVYILNYENAPKFLDMIFLPYRPHLDVGVTKDVIIGVVTHNSANPSGQYVLFPLSSTTPPSPPSSIFINLQWTSLWFLLKRLRGVVGAWAVVFTLGWILRCRHYADCVLSSLTPSFDVALWCWRDTQRAEGWRSDSKIFPIYN